MGSKSGRKRRERERRKLGAEPGEESLPLKPLEALVRPTESGQRPERPESESLASKGESLGSPVAAETPLAAPAAASADRLAEADAAEPERLSPEATSKPAPAAASSKAEADAPLISPGSAKEPVAEGPRLVHTGLLWPPLNPPRTAAAPAAIAPASAAASSRVAPLHPSAPTAEAPQLELNPSVLRDMALQIWHWDDRQRSAQRFAHARALRVWRLRLTLACAALTALCALTLLLWARTGGPRP